MPVVRFNPCSNRCVSGPLAYSHERAMLLVKSIFPVGCSMSMQNSYAVRCRKSTCFQIYCKVVECPFILFSERNPQQPSSMRYSCEDVVCNVNDSISDFKRFHEKLFV